MKALLVLRIFWMVTILQAHNIGSRIKRQILFPPEAGMGLYLAVAFPVDLPMYEISLSYNFEANYLLPTNASQLAYGPQLTEVRKARDLTRGRFYSFLEDQLENEGLLSRACLLRTICETSASPIHGHNGVIGELLHVIFTPSSTESEDLPSIYEEAEKLGLRGRENCLRSYPDCSVDLYDFFSVWYT